MASGCAIVVGIIFVIFGGCTFIVFGTPLGAFGKADPDAIALGLGCLAVGIAIIAAVVYRVRRRRRAS